MKKFLVAMVSAAMIFFGCGDDSSSSGPNDEPLSVESSSSSSSVKYSSSVEPLSSSWTPDGGIGSSSSSAKSSNSVKSSSSSSVILSVSEESSSSSVDPISSSSLQGDKLSSSSSEKQSVSSSSSADVQSSSSEIMSNSSSSEGDVSSSSSEDKVNCSVLLEGETGWSWNVPKECRFNPNIDYGSMTDSRDGKVYRTVKIGDQVWMAENLNYYDSTDLSVKKKSWCFGKKDNGDSTTCDVAGRLYTWAAAIDSVALYDGGKGVDCGYRKVCKLPEKVQGICPLGWHLPTKDEWETLFTEVGGRSVAGNVLKSRTGWNGNGNGTDAVGFTALPAGRKDGIGGFDYDGSYAEFWGATQYSEGDAYDMCLGYSSNMVSLYNYDKIRAFPIRCLKDKTPEPSAKSTSK